MAGIDFLTDKAIRASLKKAVASERSFKIIDGGGLHLEARPTGVGWWRVRYRFGGKEGMLSLGVYPDVSLAQARQRRDETRRQIAAGVDPSAKRKDDKARIAREKEAQALADAGLPGPGTFEHAAREWHGYRTPGWSAGHAGKVLAILENDLIPFIGRRTLADLTPPELLAQARRIEARGAVETAYRALIAAGAVFRYGVQKGYCTSDPTRDLKGAVEIPGAKHRAAITDPQKLGELLRAIDTYQGTPVVRAALALAPLVFLRPGELRKAEWLEFDLAGATWTIPAARMKGRKKAKAEGLPHIVPLSRQAIAILEELRPLTGGGQYLFPSQRGDDRPLSDNAILSALRRMGFSKEEVSGHGFRATARTMAVERLGVLPEVVEAQLAHAVGDALGRAYNRTQFLDQRVAMMQAWADYLDRLRDGATVVPIRAV